MNPFRLFALAIALLPLACGSPSTPPPLAATRVHTASYDSAHDDYFAAPWPDDRRLNPDGTLPTSDFPNPERGPAFDTMLTTGDGLVHGWGLSAPIYLPFNGAIDTSTLPASPTASLAPNASVFLEAIDPKSPYFRHRVPLEWRFIDAATLFLPGHILAVRPVVGFPLEPKTRYALVVTTRVKDAKGAPVGPEAAFREALQGQGTDAAWWKPLVAVLAADKLPVGAIAGATIFTTQPILDDLLAIRDYVDAQPRPEVTNLKFIRSQDGFSLFEGTYPALNFEHGTPPYEMEGGDFQWDAQGRPVPAVTENMRLSICVPDGPMPDGGFPLVFYSHGTGGDFETVVDDGTAQLFAAQGIATTGIDQVLHGTRAPPNATCFGQDETLCFFNVVNAPSGRDTIRQSAIDHVTLRRAMEGVDIPASLDPAGRDIHFNLARSGFFGHSQGGLTGALYAAIDPKLSAAMLSGTGGHLTTTLLARQSPQVKPLLEGPLFLGIDGQESLDQFHPALAVIQTLGEVADPLNYARYWFRAPLGGRRSVFLTSGYNDADTPNATAESLAIAGGVPQLLGGQRDNPSFALEGLLPEAPPLTGNIAAQGGFPSVTAGLREFPNGDHFVVFDDPTARAEIGTFFRTLFDTGTPTLAAP